MQRLGNLGDVLLRGTEQDSDSDADIDEEAQRKADEDLAKNLLRTIDKVARIEQKINELAAECAELTGPAKKKVEAQIAAERTSCFEM